MRHPVALALVVAASAVACGFEVSSGVGLAPDAATDASGDELPLDSGTDTTTDALVDDAPIDAGVTAVDALILPDATLDAPANTTPCGAINQACCANGPACKPGGQCNNNNTCSSCGNLLEACCDVGPACNAFTACVGGTCVGL